MSKILSTEDFNYNLPEELIAQVPILNREKSRLMVLDREKKDITHSFFSNIVDYFNPGDALVLNNTRVMPARIFGHRPDKQENIEFLLLNNIEGNIWESLVKPGKKAKVGNIIIFSEKLNAKIIDIKDDGIRLLEFFYEGTFNEILDELGEMPLPPYIVEKLSDKERYQTVYSKIVGSAAAPTAGLHFTNHLLEELKNKGIKIVYLTLHVGLGTFRPVKVDNVFEHKMHEEYYTISAESAEVINTAHANGKKVIAVGTTSVRTLESVFKKHGCLCADSGWTDIFIYPGFTFGVVDAMITNFHLPKSTLIMLVSAFADKEFILEAYNKAIAEKYRFFSFGDAMLIK